LKLFRSVPPHSEQRGRLYHKRNLTIGRNVQRQRGSAAWTNCCVWTKARSFKNRPEMEGCIPLDVKPQVVWGECRTLT
jgi:hypothetical protein